MTSNRHRAHVLAPPGPPPGRTGELQAESVLVLAPHYDDEVLGCGGLVARLAGAGAAVRVLFLTDSAGAGEAEEGADYGERRRREAAEAGKVLGLAGADHLELPDGRLHRHLEEAAKGIRRALLTQRPDLLLVPSPLEVTSDHRAAFRALHRLLAPLREGAAAGVAGSGGLEEVAEELEILAYEVNQAAYPDLLVDVSEQLETVERAMACYGSQQERHDYLAAGLGLRRFRTLTLPAGVRAAEGYRRLGVGDFTTRSPAQLVRDLGGVPELVAVEEGPRVSVVVRTKDRPELLAQALDSLAAGTYRPVEVVLVNDGGEPPRLPEAFPLAVVRVDLPENRGRAAAANTGVEAAGGEWIAFLDDDDLAAPEHLETLVSAAEGAGVRVAYTDAAVGIYELAGRHEEDGPDGAPAARGWVCRERRLPYSRDFDPDLLLLDNYIPFNTLLIERSLFEEVGFDPELPFFEDWDFLIRLSRLAPFHHLPRVTCEYRHFRGGGHHVLGERPRSRADFLEMKARVLARHGESLEPRVLARAVDTLRNELVEAREEVGSLRRREVEREREHRRLEAEFHRQRGEVEALREDAVHKLAELERLYAQERELRAVVEDQDRHLGRTYAEIERLQGVIRAMEDTRAWRLHQRLSRWLPGEGGEES